MAELRCHWRGLSRSGGAGGGWMFGGRLWGISGLGKSWGQKSEGAISLARNRPCLPNFRRSGSAPRSQAIVTPALLWVLQTESARPSLFRYSLRRMSFPGSICRSQFPGMLREFSFPVLLSSVAGSPEPRFRLSRVPLPVPLMAFVHSLLLEDLSSVEENNTPISHDGKRVFTWFFCGNSPVFVEMRFNLWCVCS